MFTRLPLFCLVLLTGLGAFCSGGCAKESELERRIVAGHVTYQGQAIKAGEIRFIPVNKGPVSAALIRNGEYEVTHRGGVMLGPAKVEIIATSSSAGASLEDIDTQQSARPILLPKKYNTETTLQLDVQQGSEKQTADFDLSEKSAATTPAATCPAVQLTSLC